MNFSIRICEEYFQAQSYKFLKYIEAHKKLWYSYKKEVCSVVENVNFFIDTRI